MSAVEALVGDELLSAAFAAFARHGFRRTTMADIAEAAGMSRPAVYLRASGKEALLRAVAATLLAHSLDTARAAAASTAPPADRLYDVLHAKLGLSLGLAERSEHAAELLADYARLATAEAAAYQDEIETLAATVLADAGGAPQRCAEIAGALVRAVIGFEHDLTDPAAARAQLRALSATVVAGLAAA